jgi:hypothetical protein
VADVVLQRTFVNVDHVDAGPQSIMYRAAGAKYDLAFGASFSSTALNQAIAVLTGVDVAPAPLSTAPVDAAQQQTSAAAATAIGTVKRIIFTLETYS